MKVGMYVPLFPDTPDPALTVARVAERSNVDGLFVFDHLKGLNGLTIAAALIANTQRLTIGTLVARVGVMPDAMLYSHLMTLHALAGGNFIAGLGIGDAVSKKENVEYGVEFQPREQRLERLTALTQRLKAQEVEVWLGGRSAAIRAVAQETGAAVNQWDCKPSELEISDTWSGEFTDGEHVRNLSETGTEWSVFLVKGAGKEPENAVNILSGAIAN